MTERGERHAKRDKQVATDRRTDVPTDRRSPLPPRGGEVSGSRPPRGVPEEHRALVKEARAEWEAAARKCANPYVDSAALLLVGRQALEATAWEDGLVILAAIRERMDPKASPRRIPEWAREVGAAKRNKEHRRRKSEELNAPLDPAALTAARAFIDAHRRPRPVRRDPEAVLREAEAALPAEAKPAPRNWTDEEPLDLGALDLKRGAA